MKNKVKLWKMVLVFIGVYILLCGSLILTSFIPRSAIQSKMEESAEYLCNRNMFQNVMTGIPASRLHGYADSILLNIAYNYDSAQPVKSVMLSCYDGEDGVYNNENLSIAVLGDKSPYWEDGAYNYKTKQQYLRYWHGSNVLVRSLHLFMNIRQMYVMNAVLIAVLVGVLIYMLVKRKYYAPAIGIVVSLVAVSVWFVPLNLEYTWMFLVMPVVSIIAIKLTDKDNYDGMLYLFLISGMVSIFLDFLTTETMTILMPLLLVIWIYTKRYKDYETKTMAKYTVKAMFAWGIGYVGMWVMKWVTASVVLSENVMKYIGGHIAERSIGYGSYDGNSFLQNAFYGLKFNIGCLFPWGYGTVGRMVMFALVFTYIYIAYVYKKKNTDWRLIRLYATIGSVVFVRYIVMSEHSCGHFFFTYRALSSVVLVAVLVLDELVDWRTLLHAHSRK